MFTVSSCFIANFKIGDNINQNLETLRLLYTFCEHDASHNRLLRKPVVVILVSVAEAMLYDFVDRIRSPEFVETLDKKVVSAIRDKTYSELTTLIACARKFDLFQTSDQFYDQLDELRMLRNRIHIQNEKRSFERDERNAFNRSRQVAAESALEYIAKSLASEHPRRPELHGFVADFEFPWYEYWEFKGQTRTRKPL